MWGIMIYTASRKRWATTFYLSRIYREKDELLTPILQKKKKRKLREIIFSSVQFSHSVTSNSLWSHEPHTPGLPVHHQLPESTQTHVHWVSDAIQPSHPLSSPSPPAFNLSQHQGLFKWVSSSHQVAKVLEFHLQHQIILLNLKQK